MGRLTYEELNGEKMKKEEILCGDIAEINSEMKLQLFHKKYKFPTNGNFIDQMKNRTNNIMKIFWLEEESKDCLKYQSKFVCVRTKEDIEKVKETLKKEK